MNMKNYQQKNNFIVGGTLFVIGSVLFWSVILKNNLPWAASLKATYFLGIICFTLLFIFQRLFIELKLVTNVKKKVCMYTLILATGILGYLLLILYWTYFPCNNDKSLYRPRVKGGLESY